MSNELSKPTFMIAALIGGLALFVAGFIIALEVRSTDASPAAATTGGACYTTWNGTTCAAGYTAVDTGEWTYVGTAIGAPFELICAAPKTINSASQNSVTSDTAFNTDALHTHNVVNEPCAICCASGGATVGGIGELPDVAGTGDGLARNHIIIAAVTAMVAFGAGAFYARRRWSR
jgi:hypothetical protein